MTLQMPDHPFPVRKLSIVHVTPSYAPLVGGAERLLQSVSEHLVRRGHDVTVLTFDCATLHDLRVARRSGLPKEETLNGVRVVRVDPRGGRWDRVLQWWLRRRGAWRATALFLGDRNLWSLTPPNGIRVVRPLARL